MITFETLRWKNFLSTGDQWTEIDLDGSPSTLIVGANGSGKSTMLDALCFALFNKPFRKITRGQLVNSINEKGLKVEVTFSIGRDEYRVFRGAKPNVFELYKNNKMVDQDAATKDTQKYLEQSVLKLNYKSFTQVVILGSSTFVPFMQLKGPHRREVIEDLLDIKIFSQMNLLLRDRVRATVTQSKDCDHLLTVANQKVSSQEKLLKNLNEINQSRQDERQKKISDNRVMIEGLEKEKDNKKEELSQLESRMVDVEDKRNSMSDLKTDKAEISAELKLAKKDIKFLETHEDCPTCNQNIERAFRDARIGSLQGKGKKLSKKLDKIKGDITDMLKIITEADDISMQCHEIRSDINQSERDIVRVELETLKIQDELINLRDNRPNIDKEEQELQKVQEELDEILESCAKVSKKLDEFQVVSHLLRDGGIKSQIIKKYVPVFNKLINKYLNNMDFFVNFTLDEEFNETLKSRFRDEFTYCSFSEGEKQKIDLALLFTWREVARMKNSVATNLLILDEVFDSSLDAGATNELLQILRGLGHTTNLFVISHKGEILVDKFLRTLKFEKINDFSKMSDDS
tara:strand:- start:21292 stop:23013 length:1722 start_codon:yes stop_codon:yes gene_type:complete